MRRNFLTAIVLAASLLFTAHAVPVYAQDSAGGDPLDGPALMGSKQLEGMSGAQRSAKGATEIASMRDVLAKALDLLEKTRNEERDVLKLNCINEKLSAIKGFLKIAEKAQAELDSAVARGDEKDQLHQIKLIMLASSRVQVLGEETESCAGEVVQYSGATDLDVNIDSDVRTDNPTEVDTTDVPIDPIPDVSPYQ